MATTVNEPIMTGLLPAEDSKRVLEEAINSQTSIVLRAESDEGGRPLSGIIRDRSAAHLVVEMGAVNRANLETRVSSPLHASFTLAGTLYEFDTRLVGAPGEGDPGVLRLLAPSTLAMVDRRRSRRRRFRPPGEVTLRSTGVAEAWSCRADMLNLSIDGIACRVGAKDAEVIAIGRNLQAAFRVGRPPTEFKRAARVISKTPGGSPQHVVLGMEFVGQEDSDAERERLRAVLSLDP